MAAKEASRYEVSGQVDNWQSDKSVTECLRYSLDKKILCDVTFKMGVTQKTIEAHKLILSLRSSVFMAMLNGAMAAQDDVTIPDIEPAIFEDFLQFLYTDQVLITKSNVIGLLYTSRKYDVNTLERQCMEYLESSMTPEDAVVVMEQAHLYDEHALKEKSFKLICQNGDAALQSDSVVGLCKTCLDDVIQSEELEVNEKTVFEAVFKWCETACRNLGRKITPENKREVLGDTRVYVRYPILPQEYFVNNVIPTKLLTESEEHKIMMHLLSPDKDVSPFNVKQRKTSSGQITTSPFNVKQKIDYTNIRRFDKIKEAWKCHGNNEDRIMFSVNTNSALLGFQLYGALDNTSQSYDVTAFLINASTDEIMAGSSVTTKAVAHTVTYDIFFPQAVHLKKDVQYSLIVNIKGPTTYRGKSDKSVIKNDAITCSFFDYKSSKHSKKASNGTSVILGQIPGLLLRINTEDF